MNKYHNSKGFTLIELIIVIVVLGILAVTAAPEVTFTLERQTADLTNDEIAENDVCKLTYRHPNQGEKPTITVTDCN
jgi:prepilin-type N-terminal cleavage/methylation domain-containing protein